MLVQRTGSIFARGLGVVFFAFKGNFELVAFDGDFFDIAITAISTSDYIRKRDLGDGFFGSDQRSHRITTQKQHCHKHQPTKGIATAVGLFLHRFWHNILLISLLILA